MGREIASTGGRGIEISRDGVVRLGGEEWVVCGIRTCAAARRRGEVVGH